MIPTRAEVQKQIDDFFLQGKSVAEVISLVNDWLIGLGIDPDVKKRIVDDLGSYQGISNPVI